MLKLNKKNQEISQLDNSPITTVIGSEITFNGDIRGTQSIKIDGNIKGDVLVDQGIILGEKALIEGNLKSKNIIVYGQVTGSINCNDLIIKNTGKVNGDISTNNVQIEMGGKYNGKLQMNQTIETDKDK